MAEVVVKIVSEEEVQRFDEENIFGAILPQTTHTSSTIAIVRPGESQSPHRQFRPEDGSEIIFVFRGHFELVSEGSVVSSVDVEEKGPVFVSVPSGVEAYFRNIGSVDLHMFSVFAPPFAPGEIVFSKENK